jgi:hypothetical protein
MKRLQDPLSWRELKLAWEEEERKKNRKGIGSSAPTPCDQVSNAIRGIRSSVGRQTHLNAMVFRFPHLSRANRAKGVMIGGNKLVKAATVELNRHRRPLRRQRL